MEFSRQKYWSGLPFPPLGDLPNSGIELWSCAFQVDSLPLSHLAVPLLFGGLSMITIPQTLCLLTRKQLEVP